MQTTMEIGYPTYRERAFQWCASLPLAGKIALALGMACLTGLMAQVRIYLPWTPIPITGQTFAVLLSGVLLGRWWGGASQLAYVGLGAAGVPWFAGAMGGSHVLFGPTGGYLIGFILAALFVGHMTEKHPRTHHILPMFVLMPLATLLIYIPGILHMAAWFRFVQGTGKTLGQLLWMGAIPFLAGDLLKIASAAIAAGLITPKGGSGISRPS